MRRIVPRLALLAPALAAIAACGEPFDPALDRDGEPAPVCFDDVSTDTLEGEVCACAGEARCEPEPPCTAWPPAAPCHLELPERQGSIVARSGALYWLQADSGGVLASIFRLALTNGEPQKLVGDLDASSLLVDQAEQMLAWQTFDAASLPHAEVATLAAGQLQNRRKVALPEGTSLFRAQLRDGVVYESTLLRQEGADWDQEALQLTDLNAASPAVTTFALGLRAELWSPSGLLLSGDTAHIASPSGVLTTLDLRSGDRSQVDTHRPLHELFGFSKDELIAYRRGTLATGYLARVHPITGQTSVLADLVESAAAGAGAVYWTTQAGDEPVPLVTMKLASGARRVLARLPPGAIATLHPVGGGVFWEDEHASHHGLQRLHFIPSP